MTAVANCFRPVLKPVSSLNGGLTKSNTSPKGHSLNGDEKPTFVWSVGLINKQQRFLTAETFGNKVNVTGTSLRKKQLWTLVAGKDNNVVALRSHLGKFLSIDQYGNISCEASDAGETEYFTVIESEDDSGRWALRNEKFQYFLTGDGEKLCGSSKADYWIVQLQTHPICTLRSIGRKRYARIRGDEVQCDQDVPWGQDALLTLEFVQQRYAIRTYSGMYLNRNGALVTEPNKDALFTLVFYGGQVAFKDGTRKFLSPFGNEATLRCKSPTITKSELFILEHAQPQCSLLAHNGRVVSMRQGFDLSANQESVSECEIYQLECDKQQKCWRLRTCFNKYWALASLNGVQANADSESDSAGFDLISAGGGKVALKCVKNGKFVVVRPTGHLFAQANSVNTAEHFQLLLSNRPILGLRCQYGFVGLKSSASPKLECNKSSFQSINMENGPDGAVYLQAHNGMFLDVSDDQTINADARNPKPFFIHFMVNGRIRIQTNNGSYAVAEQTGVLRANGDEQSATEWEY